MARVINDPREIQRLTGTLRAGGKRLALVPTMGALHEGHLTLIRTAMPLSDEVVVSIFVNPTQFGIGEDFERYPRDLNKDSALASRAGASIIFAPPATAVYPSGFQTSVSVEHLSQVLEGRSRPGHFRGVTTIVAKLFHLTNPHVALFGQKDAQQVAVIRRMMRDLNFDIELVAVPIVRETDGLAMSSRNAYLSPEQRSEAPVLYQSLNLAAERVRNGDRQCSEIIRRMSDLIVERTSGVIDYISIADEETLEELQVVEPGRRVLVSLAVRIGSTRLIDNIVLSGDNPPTHPQKKQ